MTVGLITRFEAWPGKEADVERTIKAALSVIQKEPGTIAWFPMRLSASTFGVFDVFPDEESRQAHLSVGERSLRARSMELVEQSLRIEKIDILAAKLPGSGL
ncbi:MAG TPA: antibiotic biosynthesis monooxygenase [Ktedonobacteraceae bacterium]